MYFGFYFILFFFVLKKTFSSRLSAIISGLTSHSVQRNLKPDGILQPLKQAVSTFFTAAGRAPFEVPRRNLYHTGRENEASLGRADGTVCLFTRKAPVYCHVNSQLGDGQLYVFP